MLYKDNSKDSPQSSSLVRDIRVVERKDATCLYWVVIILLAAGMWFLYRRYQVQHHLSRLSLSHNGGYLFLFVIELS